MTLETERLILRPWEDSDAEECYRYAKDPRVGPICGWRPHRDIENTRQVIREILQVPETYAVVLRETGLPVGSISLMFRSDLAEGEDEAELGFWLGVPFWGRGIIPEASRELLGHGFEDLGLARIWCGYYDGNIKSKRAQEKIGFRYIRTSHDVPVPQMGETRTGHVNCMTKEEWKTKYGGQRSLPRHGSRGSVKTVEIVSLSSGIIGEARVAHEVRTGFRRLKSFGLDVRFSEHSLAGLKYVKEHPEKRAEDLIKAYRDPEVDMILCAIGGDDTYRLAPYLFENGELRDALSNKIFLGFSDTTLNHFMFHKLGARTFYGQSFLADICEPDTDMLPYSKQYFLELISTGTIREIRPSGLWYDERTSFDESEFGKPRVSHVNSGFELLQGSPVFSGRILGGCIDSIYDMFDGERYADMPGICARYGLFPEQRDWKGRILLLESSEEKPSPDKYRRALEYLKDAGVFGVISGVIAGKPMDEAYAEEYKEALKDVVADPSLPVLFNLNIGHATPRCIIPFGVDAEVDSGNQVITFRNE